ncbi:hypothetical protein HYX17_05250 [Candidatus Woesearchaeota archaeon]|nr:hypothetical protein [Candidatus Woesearchaeota archaeon]
MEEKLSGKLEEVLSRPEQIRKRKIQRAYDRVILASIGYTLAFLISGLGMISKPINDDFNLYSKTYCEELQYKSKQEVKRIEEDYCKKFFNIKLGGAN